MVRAFLLSLLISQPALAVETLRIAMGEGKKEALVSGEGLSLGIDVEEGPMSPAPGGRAVVRLVGGKLEVDGAPWPLESIRFRSTAESIRADAFLVRGDVVVRIDRGALELINVIPMEDYLAAVLGSEMPSSFPTEALKAQAVAARTYALQKKLAAFDRPWHLGSSVIHQVYGGLKQEDARTRAAVEATRGEVLTWELQPIEAYFHASCGGRTENGAHALGRDLPYLDAVSCPCGALPQSRWEATLSRAELRKALGGSGGVEIRRKTRTGRATHLTVGDRTIDAVSFRRKLGYSRIKSLSFEVKTRGDHVHFSGRGYGHGAGLCQWGAKALADRGRDYREILSHYYPGTELQTLY